MKIEPRPPILFAAFRQDPAEYAAAQSLWQSLFDGIAARRASQLWTDWLNDPLRDGNPIFSRRNSARRSAVVINQWLPDDDALMFQAWMKKGGDAGSGVTAMLVVSCHLTPGSIIAAQRLIEAYVGDGRSFAAMVDLCTKAVRDAPKIRK